MTVGPSSPERFGDYYFARPLGSKGNTFLGLDLRRSWPQCICVLRRAGEKEQVSSLSSLLTAGTSHSGLVALFHAAEVEGRGVLAMEHVHGLNLRQVADAATHAEETVLPVSYVPIPMALHVASELCRGLSYLHSSGKGQQLHGRVAPSRILVGFSGLVKLSGVQYAGTPESVRKLAEQRVPDVYEAPELRDSSQLLDERADIFSVGAVLWELLTGKRLPLLELPPEQRIEKLQSLSMPSALRDEVDQGLDGLVKAALDVIPAARPPSAAVFGKQLVKYAEGVESGKMDAAALSQWMEKHCSGPKEELEKELEQLRTLAVEWDIEGARNGKVRDARESADYTSRATSKEIPVGRKKVSDEPARTAKRESPQPDRQEDFSEDLLGVVLDKRYRIEKLVGVGGMGRVYEAEHVQIGKRVAVKVLHPVYSDEPEVVERFRREARAATAIGHPNIVDVTDSGATPDGRAFFVMEYLDGMELADVIIEQKWLDPHRAVDIAIQVCHALGAAHKAGIIHRDMKPENVFLSHKEGRPDFVKILDFGIAKSAKLESVRGGKLTQPGLAMGTPEYMSPEQAAGKPADPRVDVYAVGGILYAMLVGRPPHQGANIMEILTKKATEPPVPLRDYRPEIAEELEEVVLSALNSRPDSRPQTMEELEYQLRKFQSGRGAAVAAILGLKHVEAEASNSGFYKADTPTSAAMAVLPADLDVADLEVTGVAEAQAEPVEIVQPAERPAKPPPARDQQAKSEPSSKAATAPRPKTVPPDLGYLKSVTMPVVKRTKKGKSWVWMVVLLGVVGGVAGSAFFLKYGTTGKTTPSATRAAAADATAGPDGQVVAARTSDGGALGVDASKGGATRPPPPRLTKAQISALAKKAWGAARKKRWTRPKKKSLWHYLGQLEQAAPDHRAVPKLKGFARKALMRKAALQYRRKSWRRVELAYRDLLALIPDDSTVKSRLVGVLTRRARQHFTRGATQKALVLAEEAVLLDGTSWSARYILAQILEKKGQYKASASEYSKVVKSKAPRKVKASARKLLARVKKRIR